MAITSATRSILDAAEAGTAPEQIEMAVTQAMDRGLATARNSNRTRMNEAGEWLH